MDQPDELCCAAGEVPALSRWRHLFNLHLRLDDYPSKLRWLSVIISLDLNIVKAQITHNNEKKTKK